MNDNRILMIDDDVKLCRLVKDYLAPFGFSVEAAHDGLDGLEKIKTGNFAVIILDVMLPKLNGFEVLKQIRQISTVPVLMLTALGDESDRIVGLEIGADDYLPKTFSTRELLARLPIHRSSFSIQHFLIMRFSLFSKIMLWFFLNLLLLAAIFLILFNFRFAPSSFFRGTAYRIETVARLINEETNEKTRAERDEILKAYGELNRVEFFLFDNAGRQLGGREIELPTEVYEEITRPDSPPGARRRNPPPGRGPPPSIYLKTENPPLYWYGIKIMSYEGGSSQPIRTRLLAASDSFFGYGLFFDPTAWLVAAAIIVIVSLLFWLPFVRGITRNIAQMTDATEQIAEEKFDVRVGDKRTDEIGRLGAAINQLASRLSGFVSGQKRFLGDISHELNSPLARMQFALSILEDRVDGKNRGYVVDAKEEVELMSKLVGELLEYSKAGIKTTEVNLVKIRLRPLVETVIEREKTTETAEVKIIIADNIEVLAQPELLSRAIANVVRNAVCYAGKAGEIKVSATNGKNQVKIEIADNGAGVPEDALEKLFDPFYCVESNRARQSGGTGLGLAIVKTCIEACQGKVSASNRIPQGLAVTISLKN